MNIKERVEECDSEELHKKYDYTIHLYERFDYAFELS